MKTEKEIPGLAKRIRKLRGEMSQEDFSKKIGISRVTVCFYETGRRLPDAQNLKTIATTCGVSVDYLLGLSEKVQLEAPDIKETHKTKRTFILTLSCEDDGDDSLNLIQADLAQEIGRCWHDFQIESVAEITPGRTK